MIEMGVRFSQNIRMTNICFDKLQVDVYSALQADSTVTDRSSEQQYIEYLSLEKKEFP